MKPNPSAASLMISIQSLRHLCWFNVDLKFLLPSLSAAGALVYTVHTKCKERLAELTYFRFYGQRNEVEWLVAGLGTPSLRELRISAMHFSSTCHIPSLSKFIRVAGIFFFAAKFTISGSFLMTFLFSRPRSIDNPPAKVVTIDATFVAHRK
jgi:hypothetical protein